MIELADSDWLRLRLAAGLVAHTRLYPPSGKCSCGHTVPKGGSFAEHQSRALIDALELRVDRPGVRSGVRQPVRVVSRGWVR